MTTHFHNLEDHNVNNDCCENIVICKENYTLVCILIFSFLGSRLENKTKKKIRNFWVSGLYPSSGV
jgi:hypothetical protein